MIVASSASNIRVTNFISQKRWDVISVGWITDCISKNRLLPKYEHNFLYLTEPTREDIRRTCDPLGDSYDEFADVESVRYGSLSRFSLQTMHAL